MLEASKPSHDHREPLPSPNSVVIDQPLHRDYDSLAGSG
jgi:hypothetical protein